MLIKIFENIKNNVQSIAQSLVQPIDIRIENIVCSADKQYLKNLKLVQISDLHINGWNISLIESCIDKINSLKPDMVFVTGDVICSGYKYLADLKDFFKKVNSTYGIFACLGNHDHSDGENGKKVLQMYSKAGVRVLNNESECLNIENFNLHISGVGDLQSGQQNIIKATKDIPEQESFLLLAHNPKSFEEFNKYGPMAVFAGHTHGGQIFLPFINKIYEKHLNNYYIRGRYEGENSMLYVNRGLGTSMLSSIFFNKKFYLNTPRINSRPEITVFKFV